MRVRVWRWTEEIPDNGKSYTDFEGVLVTVRMDPERNTLHVTTFDENAKAIRYSMFNENCWARVAVEEFPAADDLVRMAGNAIVSGRKTGWPPKFLN